MTVYVERSRVIEIESSFQETRSKGMRPSKQVAVERVAKSPAKSAEGSSEKKKEKKRKDNSSPVGTKSDVNVRKAKIARMARVLAKVNGFRLFKGPSDVTVTGLSVPSTTKLEQRYTAKLTELNFRFKSTYYTDVLKPEHLPWMRWNGLVEFAKLDWIKDRVPIRYLVDVVRSFNPESRMCSFRGVDLQLTNQYLKKTFRLLGEDVKQPKPPYGWIPVAFPTPSKKGYKYTSCTDPLVQERLGFVQLTLQLSLIRSDACRNLIFMVEDIELPEKGWIGMFCASFWSLMSFASAEVDNYIQLRLAPHIRILFDEPEWTAQLPKQVKPEKDPLTEVTLKKFVSSPAFPPALDVEEEKSNSQIPGKTQDSLGGDLPEDKSDIVTIDFANFRNSIAKTVRDMQSAIDKLKDEKTSMEVAIDILEQSRKRYREEKQQADQWKVQFEQKKLQPLRDHLQELKKLSEADQAEIVVKNTTISDLAGQLASEVRTHLKTRDRVKSLEEEIAKFGKVRFALDYAVTILTRGSLGTSHQ